MNSNIPLVTIGNEKKMLENMKSVRGKTQDNEKTTLILPSGGVTFRIDSVYQLARAGDKRFVCTLPFCLAGNRNLSVRMKVWFSRAQELRLSLLATMGVNSCHSLNESKSRPTLRFSGQAYHKSRDMFCDLWMCTMRLQDLPSSPKLTESGDDSSEVSIHEEVFPLMADSIRPDLLRNETQPPLVPDKDSDVQTGACKDVTCNSIHLEDLRSSGFINDNTLTFKWDVRIE
ncbi:hypothetical protein PoB_003508900 [Plakobranchus ocellatus]|uniref:Uncharacterized protein n=1 Tax=Plakobranchus ocellatus TaxID=259542 RepID=A0AAV4ALF9_9GAST|nr:hypothetical protein PoB_003508900 [Plakobranchus ocellatus]